jgi:ribosomal protein S18 acetylase RimI-like enzyme
MNDPGVRFEWPSRLDEPTRAQVIDLYNAVIEHEDILGYPCRLTGRQADSISASLAGAVAAGDVRFFAVRAAADLIGMALLTPNRLPNCAHIVELSKGIIHPDRRGRGVMEAALLEIAAVCQTGGLDIITLDVREHCKSHRLWRNVGFREYGRLEDYARTGGVAHAGVYMFTRTADLIARLRRGRKRLGATSLMQNREVQPC